MNLKFNVTKNNDLIHAVEVDYAIDGEEFSLGTNALGMITESKSQVWEYEFMFAKPQQDNQVVIEMYFNSGFDPIKSHPYVDYHYDVNCSESLSVLKKRLMEHKYNASFINRCFEMIADFNKKELCDEKNSSA